MNNLKAAAVSAVSTIVVAGIGFLGGYWTFSSTQVEQVAPNREIDLKMIDVGLAILAGEKGADGGKQSVEARRFAVRILRQYSEIEPKRDNEQAIDWDKWADSVEDELQIDRDLVLSKNHNTSAFEDFIRSLERSTGLIIESSSADALISACDGDQTCVERLSERVAKQLNDEALAPEN